MSIYERFSEKELEILRTRAKRVANTGQTHQQEDLITALIIRTNDEVYALPVDAVTGVYEDVFISPLPCVPAFVAGVANLRGHLIPVLDLATLLDIPGAGTQEKSSTVVVAAGRDFSVALLVDKVNEVSIVTGSEIQPFPNTLDLPHPNYVKGVMADGTIFLELENILNDPSLIVDQL
jgi:purine-binding chemotaxis protein CheW